MAKTIISKANFLMLDEPTNHLDMHSCDLLIEALNKYQGTYILVSHDRFFISKTANKIWEIDNHKIKEFKGGYDEWVLWKERMAKNEVRSPKSEKSEKSNGSNKSNRSNAVTQASDPRPPTSAINKEAKKELQKMQKRFQQLEEQIGGLNTKKMELESSLVDPAVYSDKTKFRQAEEALKRSNDELMILNKEYEKVFDKILELEQKNP